MKMDPIKKLIQMSSKGTLITSVYRKPNRKPLKPLALSTFSLYSKRLTLWSIQARTSLPRIEPEVVRLLPSHFQLWRDSGLMENSREREVRCLWFWSWFQPESWPFRSLVSSRDLEVILMSLGLRVFMVKVTFITKSEPCRMESR